MVTETSKGIGKVIKVDGDALKGDGEMLTGAADELNGDAKAFMVCWWVAWKGYWMALEGDEEALNDRWCGGAKGWWICVLGRWEGVKDIGESLKGNWKKLNHDGEMSKSDRKASKGQEKVLKVIEMH